MIHVAVMGYGTIGSGVVEILEKNRETIAKRTGEPVDVKYVLDLREFPGTPVEHKIVHDFAVIENDPEVTMVIETMGFKSGIPLRKGLSGGGEACSYLQ